MDRHLKSNTVKTCTHSLFRQGCMLYDLIPTMPEPRLRPLVERYAKLLQQSRVVTKVFAIIPFPGDCFDHESSAHADFRQPRSKCSAGKRIN
jgi:hypothetical protein